MSDLRKAAQAVVHAWDTDGPVSTIEDLRAALAQPEQDLQLVANLLKEYGLEAMEVIAALKTKPEPMLNGLTEEETNASASVSGLTRPKPEPVAYQWLGTSVIRRRIPKTAEADAWQPLYTHPPQRKSSSQEAMTRKPLTDDEIKNIVDLGLQTWKLSESTYAFARAIEAAHGIGVE